MGDVSRVALRVTYCILRSVAFCDLRFSLLLRPKKLMKLTRHYIKNPFPLSRPSFSTVGTRDYIQQCYCTVVNQF